MDNTINSARLQKQTVFDEDKIQPDKFSQVKRKQLGNSDPNRLNVFEHSYSQPGRLEQAFIPRTSQEKSGMISEESTRTEAMQKPGKNTDQESKNAKYLSNSENLGKNVDIYA